MTYLIYGLLIGVPLGIGVETWLRYSRNRVAADITAVVDATREVTVRNATDVPPDELDAIADGMYSQAARLIAKACLLHEQAQVARCKETKALRDMYDASP